MGRKTAPSRSARGPSPSAALPPAAFPGPRGTTAAPAAAADATAASSSATTGGMEEAAWTACRGILEAVYKAKEGTRRVCEIFRELPDREEWADYYVAIPEPESLDNISTQLGAQAYDSPEEFFKQLHLVFLNAKHYNEEDSQVWIDAKRLEEQVLEAWRAAAAEGMFASPDPYHKPRARKPKIERGSTTPAPGAAPSPAAAAVSAPSPAPAMAKTKSREKVKEEPTKGKDTPAPVPAQAGKSTVHLKIPPIPAAQQPQAEAKPATRGSAAATTSTSASAHAQTRALAPAPNAAPPAPAAPTTRTTRHSSGSLPAPSTSPAKPISNSATIPGTPTRLPSIVPSPAALDAVLPRWPGPQVNLPGPTGPTSTGGIPGNGWWGEGAPSYEASVGGHVSWKQRIKSVVGAIAGYRDAAGVQLAITFALVPRMSDIPYLSYNMPLAFSGIQQAAESGSYSNLRELDLDMTRLFEKARRALDSRPVEYGRILTLQRLYQALTAPYPLQIPPAGVPAPSRNCFASLPAGPGVARSQFDSLADLGPGAKVLAITTPRCGHKDRQFTAEARHKGVSYRVGDFVHLVNPDDPSRPIVGQIFKTFVPTKGYPTHHVTVCWYFRPEQTVHPADRKFFEREVFKTTHFCDHPVEDIIEHVSCQVHGQYIRGRPKAPQYYPGWPLYLCASRYNDRDWFMVVIKNWLACMPEAVRKAEFIAVNSFGRTFEPATTTSPFVRGIRGPGLLARPKRAPGPEDEEDEAEDLKRQLFAVVARRAAAGGVPPTGGETPQRPGVPTGMTPQTMPAVGRAPGSGAPFPGPQGPHGQRPLGPGGVATPTPQGGRQQVPPGGNPIQQPTGPFAHRTMTMVMGGPQVVEQHAKREVLPAETVAMFEQDRHGQVLWFSGPPIAPGSVKVPKRPAHSLEYLAYLVKKRGASTVLAVESEGGGQGQSERQAETEDGKRKRGERYSGPTVGAVLKRRKGDEDEGEAEGDEKDEEEEEAQGEEEEDLSKLWWAAGMTQDEVIASLRAVATGSA